jgi:hypothetical protein
VVLYDLTRPDIVAAILREGLNADDDGMINLFTSMTVADTIARDQLLARRYAVVSVSPKGISGQLRHRNVAGCSAGCHRTAQQLFIAPEHLTFVGMFEA